MSATRHWLCAFLLQRSALFALLAIAGMQLVAASHQFSHDDLAPTDVCSVCMHLEQLDEAVVANVSAPAAASVDAVIADSRSVSPARVAFRLYAPRAPPVI